MKLAKLSLGLDFLVVPLVAASLALAFLYVPMERTMGEVQRIFYFHVPFALSSFFCFAVVLVASLGYLATRRDRWDVVGNAAAEVGFLACTVVLLTGPVWARAAWNVWWTWDARLTTTLVLWLIYAGYLLLRAFGTDEARTRRFASVLGVVGALDVPIVYLSVKWFRTQHPSATFFTREGLPVPEMAFTLRFCLLSILLLVISLMLKRIEMGFLRLEVDRLSAERRALDS